MISAVRMPCGVTLPVWASQPMKPPANESPAPVGSTTVSMGKGGAAVEVGGVAAGPAEGAPLRPLQAAQVDAEAGQELLVGAGEVGPHHPDQADRREEGGRRREVRGRSPQHLVALVLEGLHAVE